eukprot:CAMPEP_0117573030 /NCGR_PEP_ID=MMETSP0784-20121206/60709_1 /TAXON_ID=39447 /ORGANISM="" /LENGTH=51 /DNA_ID=CAMNT_0005371513 /DNA_START=67 /DNA_END=218 /DNA_ORIENTATION=+
MNLNPPPAWPLNLAVASAAKAAPAPRQPHAAGHLPPVCSMATSMRSSSSSP